MAGTGSGGGAHTPVGLCVAAGPPHRLLGHVHDGVARRPLVPVHLVNHHVRHGQELALHRVLGV